MSKKKDEKEQTPLCGTVHLQATKGIVLPVFVTKGQLVRITEAESVKINVDEMPYSAKNILAAAYAAGEVVLVEASKGGV